MAVHPFHRIGSGEGQRPRQHFVKRDAQRVEIAARIDRAVHPTGLQSIQARKRGIFRRDQQDRRQSLAGTPIQRQLAGPQR